MSDPLILASTEAGVRTLTFHRPAKKNAFTPVMYAALVEELERAARDPKVRVVLLTGAGDAFTSGNDLMDFAQTPPAGRDSPVFKLLLALVDHEKPIVAAVNGVAVGIGTTMLLHCDLVYAADSARFRMPFVNLGLVPEGASSLLLPLLAGPQRAAELLMFGDFFSAADAHAAGLVNAVTPAADVLAHATARARALAERPAASIRHTKALLRHADRAAVHAALDREGEVFLARLSSPEATEAFSAFFEKRTPDFSRFD
jgi:enoyl-CoA hydratase/carnithine racemase